MLCCGLEILPEFKGLNMIVDIGNGTMNAMFLQDGRPVENKMWTELFGVRQCAFENSSEVIRQVSRKMCRIQSSTHF